jgi:predicted RNA methylase
MIGFVALGLFVTFMVSIVWTQHRGAPWVPSTRAMVTDMLTLADVQPGDTVYDLGCGDGRFIITAARRYGATAVGIEIDPFRYLWCQMLITVLRLRGQVRVVFGDFFKQDLSDADVITCYLLHDTNQKLEGKLKKELRFATRVVSNTFRFVGMDPVRTKGQAKLYVFYPQSPTN